MNYQWYLIFNLAEFLELGLVSKTYTVTLQGIGTKSILVTKGNLTSMVYEDVMLSINLNDRNPFYFDGFGVFLQPTTNDVYLGIENEE